MGELFLVDFDGLKHLYYLINERTRPDVVFGLGDDYLIARVRTLCFKSLFIV